MITATSVFLLVDDVSLCFSGWLFGNEAVSSSSFVLSLPPGTDCKKNLSVVK